VDSNSPPQAVDKFLEGPHWVVQPVHPVPKTEVRTADQFCLRRMCLKQARWSCRGECTFIPINLPNRFGPLYLFFWCSSGQIWTDPITELKEACCRSLYLHSQGKKHKQQKNKHQRRQKSSRPVGVGCRKTKRQP